MCMRVCSGVGERERERGGVEESGWAEKERDVKEHMMDSSGSVRGTCKLHDVKARTLRRATCFLSSAPGNTAATQPHPRL